MTEGPDWAETLSAVKKVPGNGRTKNDRLGMDQVQQWQEFQQQRTGADVAVAVGGVDTGDDYDGWSHFTNWAADQVAGFVNIWNGWFESGGTGTPAQTQYVIESIKDAVINGYTVHTVTSDETNWPVPSHTECIGIAIGGGQNGQGGNGSASAVSSIGGLDGSYVAQHLDLTGITALDIQVGTAGNRSYVREANTTTPHSGTVVLQSPPHGSDGGVSTPLGYTPTTSTPGRGGNGGGWGAGAAAATAGESSAVGAGGAAGGDNGTWGLPGQPGGAVSAGALTKCGGGGGGGGGAARVAFNVGGNGGAGGYPGGGGGAGGNASIGPAGSGGPGAPGVVFIYTR